MTVAKPVHPARGAKLMYRALGARMGIGGRHGPLQGAPRLGAGLPVYRLDDADAPLGKARKTGWKYIVVGGKVPGLAVLHHDKGEFIYAGLFEGLLPRRTLEAAICAEQELRKSKTRYRPRLLEIPALNIHALWLYAPGGNSRFVLISRPHRRPRYSVETSLDHHIKATRDLRPPAKSR